MTNDEPVIILNERRAPVVYTVRIVHHWNDTLEFYIEDVADDERSRKSVMDAFQRISGLQAPADALYRELLMQIDTCLAAKFGTPEAEPLERLANLAVTYAMARYPTLAARSKKETEK